MSEDKLVYLAHSNNRTEVGERCLIACKECKNKAFSLIWKPESFPMVECTACHAHIGLMGWADDEA